jgi:hypothetical protein
MPSSPVDVRRRVGGTVFIFKTEEQAKQVTSEETSFVYPSIVKVKAVFFPKRRRISARPHGVKEDSKNIILSRDFSDIGGFWIDYQVYWTL